MTTHRQLLDRVAAVNPHPTSEPLPEHLRADRPDVDGFLNESLIVGAVLEPESGIARVSRASRWRGPLVAFAAAAVLVVVVVAGSLLLGGGDSVPPTETVTTIASTSTTIAVEGISDPWGLGSAVHPTNQNEVNVVFLAMPGQLGDMTATRDSPDHVGFVDYQSDGERATVGWFEAGFDTASTIDFLTAIESLDGFTTIAGDLTTESDFIWLTGVGELPDETVHHAWWGSPSTGWLLSAEASSSEQLDVVICAYLDALQRSTVDDAIVSYSTLTLLYAPANGMVVNSTDAFTWFTGNVRPCTPVTMNGRYAEMENSGDGGCRWVIQDEPSDEQPPSLMLDLQEGQNVLGFEAVLDDGTVLTENRSIYYEPALTSVTGWIVDYDPTQWSITLAVAPWESPDDEPWQQFGEVTSVDTYQVTVDAAFILLSPESSGEPASTVIEFEAFTAILDLAEAGECGDPQCFYGSHPGGITSPPDEPGEPFAVLFTPDGQIRQLEQVWSP